MNLEVLSYILALVLGGLCFYLVKRTADEFDRWYGQPDESGLRAARVLPAVVGLLVTILAFALRATLL
jgi:hypothetical protein